MTQRDEDIARERLDAMTLEELAREFDSRCESARRLGLWLFERDPEFTRYSMFRMRELAILGAGSSRKTP